MKKTVFFTFFFMLSIYAFCAAPKWLTSLEKYYPNENYIRTIGEGKTKKMAEQEAISSIALTFNSKVKVVNSAVTIFNNIITEEKSVMAKSYSLQQQSQISSEAELFFINFSDSYYNKRKKIYYVVGYIDRKAASQYYNQKIESIINQIIIILEYADKEKESLYTLLNYQKAINLSKIASAYIDNACIVNPSESKRYAEDLILISKLQADIQILKKKNSFSVECKNNKYRSVGTGLSAVLEQSGFVNSAKDPKYHILIDIHFTEETYEAGFFVRPDMIITVTNSLGEPIDSYSKAYPRYSHQTIENAYNLSLVRIQQDLEENFMMDYRGE